MSEWSVPSALSATPVPFPEEEELRPAFPLWLRRHIPLLAAEDTNPLFEAFRRRRVIHRSARSPLGFLYRIPVALIQLFLTLLFFAVATAVLVVMGMEYLWVAVIPFALLAFVQKQRNRLLTKPRMFYASLLFNVRKPPQREAMDIWMTGVRGRDVLEAIFLEQVEAQWARLSLFAILPFVVGMLIHSYFSDEFGLAGTLFAFSLAYFCMEAFLSALVSIMALVRENSLWPRVKYWNAHSSLGRALVYSRKLKSLAVGVVLYPLGIVLILVSVRYLVPSAQDLRGMSGLPLWLARHQIELLISGVVVVAGILLRVFRSRMRRSNVAQCYHLFAQADEIFDSFMRRTIGEDTAEDIARHSAQQVHASEIPIRRDAIIAAIQGLPKEERWEVLRVLREKEERERQQDDSLTHP